MKRVSKLEFENFIDAYQNELEFDCCGISDPPLITYNDFSLGKWPDSIVAQTHAYSDDENDYYYEPEELRKYYIKN